MARSPVFNSEAAAGLPFSTNRVDSLEGRRPLQESNQLCANAFLVPLGEIAILVAMRCLPLRA